MAKYSEFINFPIYLYSSKEVHTLTQAQTGSEYAAPTWEQSILALQRTLT